MCLKKAYNDYALKAVDYINRIDPSFCRIDKTYFSSASWFGSLNDGLMQGDKGNSCCNSLNQLYNAYYMQLVRISNKASKLESKC